jgi:hypothetical protein
MLEFGYGSSQCSVSRYWDRPRLFAVHGADAELLVLACGRNALILIVNYGAASAAEIALDLDGLALPRRGTCSDPERLGQVSSTDTGCRLTLGAKQVRWIERRGEVNP